MIYSGKVTTTPGTPKQLLTAQTRASWIVIQWPSSATGNMYIGGNPITSGNAGTLKPFSANTPGITPGNSITLPPLGVNLPYTLDTTFIDSDNAATAVFLYGKA